VPEPVAPAAPPAGGEPAAAAQATGTPPATPSAAPAPAAGLGLIEVVTTPPGASLFVDGKPFGKKSPTMIDSLPLGVDHAVLVQLPGHHDEVRKATIPASG